MPHIDLDAIYTHADGRPIGGHPGPKPTDPTLVVAWLRRCNTYRDRVTDVANQAFADAFQKAAKP